MPKFPIFAVLMDTRFYLWALLLASSLFTLGYSHPIEFPLPTGIEVAIDPKQTHLTITGVDRQKVGQVAADMRSLRKPDPYKNKGVRYSNEKLKKKAGKTGAK